MKSCAASEPKRPHGCAPPGVGPAHGESQNLQANCSRASRLTMVPSELVAKHWYVPASRSRLGFRSTRLPPLCRYRCSALGSMSLPFSRHLEGRQGHVPESALNPPQTPCDQPSLRHTLLRCLITEDQPPGSLTATGVRGTQEVTTPWDFLGVRRTQSVQRGERARPGRAER